MKIPAIEKVFVIGIGQWRHEYTSIPDAIACIHGLSQRIAEAGPRLDFIEIMVEFETGESERCKYRTEAQAVAWLQRFTEPEAVAVQS